MSVCCVMVGRFGVLFLCGTNSDSNNLLAGHAAVVSVTPIGRSSAEYGVPSRWCTPHIGLTLSENLLTCIFLRAWLGVMDQFRDLRAHPILRSLISSCGDTLRTCLQDPCDLPHELKLRIVASIETVTLQMLENLWRETEYSFDILRETKGAHVEVI
jgi:hypothetical protein